MMGKGEVGFLPVVAPLKVQFGSGWRFQSSRGFRQVSGVREGNRRRVQVWKAAAVTPGFNPDEKRTAPTEASMQKVFEFLATSSKSESRIRTRLIVALLLMLASKCLNLVYPFMFKAAVDTGTTGAIPPYFMEHLSKLTHLTGGSIPATATMAAIFIALFGLLKLMSSVMHELRNVVFSRAQYAIGRRVTRQAFEHIHSLDADFHSHSRTGALVRIVDRGTRSINGIFRVILFSFMPSLIEAVMVGTLLASLFAPAYAAITLSSFVIYVAATLILNDRMMKTRKRMNQVENEASGKLNDSLTNFQTVKIFNNEKFESQRYDTSLSQLEGVSVKNDKEYAVLNIIQGTIFNVGSTIVLLLSMGDIMSGVRTVGDLVMAGTLLQQMWTPLQFIGWQYRELRQTLVDMENLLELLDRKPLINDVAGATPLKVSEGAVTFDNVRFRYGDGEEVLKGVSFTVPAGKTAAVVGPSGSGKSTLLSMLFRLYEPSGGRVLIDGQDVTQVTMESLRAEMGMIPQDTVLFNDTIEYNIAYAKPGATSEEVEKAATLARIAPTIERMKSGYQTKVGERGLRLSGGEKQRVAIARCMLKAPRILLQDEATSALDTKTEIAIADSLAEIGRERTCIIVAHRLSTVINADEIIVLRHGEIVERGTHSELLQLDGVYSEMWNQQKSEEDEVADIEDADIEELHSKANGRVIESETETAVIS